MPALLTFSEARRSRASDRRKGRSRETREERAAGVHCVITPKCPSTTIRSALDRPANSLRHLHARGNGRSSHSATCGSAAAATTARAQSHSTGFVGLSALNTSPSASRHEIAVRAAFGSPAGGVRPRSRRAGAMEYEEYQDEHQCKLLAGPVAIGAQFTLFAAVSATLIWKW